MCTWAACETGEGAGDITKDSLLLPGPSGRAGGGGAGDCAGPQLIHLHCCPPGSICMRAAVKI